MSPGGQSGEPGRLRRWLAGRTLRGRLIAGLLVLLVVAFAAIGIVTSAVLSNTLIQQVDAQLVAAGTRYSGCVEHNSEGHQQPGEGSRHGAPPGQEDCNNSIPGQAAGTFGARVKHGTVTAEGIVGRTSIHLSARDRAALIAMRPDRQFQTLDLRSLGGDYRVMALAGHDHDMLITGIPLAGTESTVRKVELAELIIFAGALALTGVIGTGWVRLSLRPLRRVAATAARVTKLPLASGAVTLPERVPDMDPRTEVGQVGTAFNRMLGHVESALARRAASEARLRRFAADASHELRTPLSAIRGYAELARRHPGPVPAEVAHALSRVESESARMSMLVDELLLLAQLDAGRPLAQEPVDLTRLVIDAASDARAASPGHKWQLELPDEPLQVRGDEHRLRQVLTNLVSNAGKHTPPGTTVTIALAGNRSGMAELSVTDDGPGIAPDLLPGLFERFVRGDTSRSRAAGSTGLGLAIVDAVTAAHGGRVDVTSRPGHTRFTVALPRLTMPEAHQPAGDGAGASTGGPPAGELKSSSVPSPYQGRDPNG